MLEHEIKALVTAISLELQRKCVIYRPLNMNEVMRDYRTYFKQLQPIKKEDKS